MTPQSKVKHRPHSTDVSRNAQNNFNDSSSGQTSAWTDHMAVEHFLTNHTKNTPLILNQVAKKRGYDSHLSQSSKTHHEVMSHRGYKTGLSQSSTTDPNLQADWQCTDFCRGFIELTGHGLCRPQDLVAIFVRITKKCSPLNQVTNQDLSHAQVEVKSQT